MLEIIAQIIGMFGIGLLTLSYQMPQKKKIIIFQIAAISIFTLHFSLLGAWTGAVMNGIALVKTVIYYFEDRKWFNKTLFTVIFLVVIISFGIITWVDIFSIFPILAMVVNTLAFNFREERKFRFAIFPASPLWLVYNLHIISISGIIGEIFTTTSTIIAIVRYDILKKSKKEKK